MERPRELTPPREAPPREDVDRLGARDGDGDGDRDRDGETRPRPREEAREEPRGPPLDGVLAPALVFEGDGERRPREDAVRGTGDPAFDRSVSPDWRFFERERAFCLTDAGIALLHCGVCVLHSSARARPVK